MAEPAEGPCRAAAAARGGPARRVLLEGPAGEGAGVCPDAHVLPAPLDYVRLLQAVTE
ncbi:MAG: hypothetical protein JXR37_19805 [Kiritimatiellae bacterium]|nr:hypothetical protein [Kiritimatiellia bacterium]